MWRLKIALPPKAKNRAPPSEAKDTQEVRWDSLSADGEVVQAGKVVQARGPGQSLSAMAVLTFGAIILCGELSCASRDF